MGIQPPIEVLHFFDRRGVLEDGVVAGPVGEADDVNVGLDQPRHHRTPAEIDDAGPGGAGEAIADPGDAVVVDPQFADDPAGGVERVDAPVGQDEVWRGRGARRRGLRGGVGLLPKPHGDGSARGHRHFDEVTA
jgi:hypothetical protein